MKDEIKAKEYRWKFYTITLNKDLFSAIKVKATKKEISSSTNLLVFALRSSIDFVCKYYIKYESNLAQLTDSESVPFDSFLGSQLKLTITSHIPVTQFEIDLLLSTTTIFWWVLLRWLKIKVYPMTHLLVGDKRKSRT